MKRLSIIFLCLVAWICARSEEVKYSLITCYPGSEIYELDGHTALRVRDGANDVVLSWGVFDFNSPNFVYRFVKGETDYLVAPMPFDRFIESYRRDGRKVVEQPLDADSVASERLMELLIENLRPENRVYRYNYVKDNCATRPMSLIETSGAATFSGEYVSEDRTFREVMRRFHRNYPWYQFGIDLALGSGIDYTFTPDAQAFSPMLLMQMLPVESIVLADGADTGTVLSPTPWFLTPVAVFTLMFIIVAWACVWAIRRRRVAKWLYCVFYSAMGLAGCLLTFLIFVSVHEATSPNWLLLFFNPLCLIPAIFIWAKRCRKLVVCYQIVNFAFIIAGCALWPLTGQSMNAAVWPILATDICLSATYLYINFKTRAFDASTL